MELESFCREHGIPPDHGVEHVSRVVAFAKEAVNDFELSEEDKRCVILSALLHDVDDRKFFPHTDYRNAKMLLSEMWPEVSPEREKLIINMISLVSAWKNGDSIVEPRWMLIPRDCDRLDAIGVTGVKRCFDYTIHHGEPLWSPETPLAVFEDQLDSICAGRFEKYQSKGKSDTALDHFYDKLLHIKISSGSKCLEHLHQIKMAELRTITVCFGKLLSKA